MRSRRLEWLVVVLAFAVAWILGAALVRELLRW